MNLEIYPRLSTRSKRAICKASKYWGHQYNYEPRPILVKRLSEELQISEEEVRKKIKQERKWLLANEWYI